ncbi:zinc finger protein 564 [Drosophila guanche]|uniref:Blast:Zinc finger protein 333 n=1 Tax=Drosophila guanche TaxID=7266 RepID=A0A3B0JJ01_DROGU|nr:zinc finger protein 564 [Drosophila guanche]SPP80733.1 blast:Zinc finger protein 333 [Drosophila guanche]
MANAPKNILAKTLTPIRVRVFDLPEYIFVQTKLIPARYARENGIVPTRIKRPCTRPNAAVAAQPAKLDHQPPKTVSLISYSAMQPEEPKNPVRERFVQTEEKLTCDVGVQCDIDDWEEEQIDKDCKRELPNEEEDEETKFITFVVENTSMIRNGMMECLVCGEVARSLQQHKSHIVMHYGPPVLCSYCGELVNHELLLQRHILTCPSRPSKKPSIFLKCPNMFCNIMTRTLPQLYKHLSTHEKQPRYRCLQCRFHFRTAVSFLLHRKKKQSCARAKALFLFDKQSALQNKGDRKRCTVCLKKFSNERLCGIHRLNCIQAIHRKVTRKLFKPSMLA